MSTYNLQTHSVTAVQIERVAPLITGGGSRMATPDQGIVLYLSDGTKRNWMIEGVPPVAGDWLVSDQELHTVYAVSAAKFSELFIVAE